MGRIRGRDDFSKLQTEPAAFRFPHLGDFVDQKERNARMP
jgi:hypothetical protein